ncbi:MAG: alpha/beta hydrolase [Bacteroidia bacterium]|jgi:alpha-beta hydrolase superfamily lysophospholipase|nr:alpha/beta hydrolase [Bacteroidia bacterium]
MSSSVIFTPDSELSGFESATLAMGTDYEGEVFCTLTRKISQNRPPNTLLHVHGFNDYFFHAEAASFFFDNGLDYYGLDLRKSGRSWRKHQKYNNLRDINEYFEDIASAIELIRRLGAEKILLMGHSMGGLVTACYCASPSENPLPDALFLNSPFLEQNKDIVTRRILIPIVSKIGKTNPDLPVPGGFSKFYGPSLHASEKGEWSYNLLYKPHRSDMVNAGWVRTIHQAQSIIKKGIRVELPLLLMYPQKSVAGLWWTEAFHYGDAVVNVKHIRALQRFIHASDKTVHEIKHARHDLFLSVRDVRQSVYNLVLEWSQKHLKH